MRFFESSPDRSVPIRYVKAHDGQAGNERADELVKKGETLRGRLLEREWGEMGIGEAMGDYWVNRKSESD